MIESLISWSIKNRGIVLLLTLILIGAGWVAVSTTPVDALPDLSDVQVIIKTPYPGQAPQVVEDHITYPLSSAMLSVPKARTVRGYSFFGDSYVYIIFDDGTDLYWARARVLEYLNQVLSQLPPTVAPTIGPDATGVGWVYEYALIDRTRTHDLSQLRSIQDWFLKFELQTVPGVSEVATVGGMVKQYQVVVDPDKLRVHGITLAKIRQAIQEGNRESGGSVIEMAEGEYMVRASGYVKSLDDLANIPLGLNAHGTPLKLDDIANLRIGPQMRRGIAELNGEGEVVGGIVVMRSGGNALETIVAVRARLKELRGSLPDGVEIVETYDQSSLIERAIANLRNTLIQESIIVALVCAFFLFHLRSSLVVIITLPIAIFAAFVVMRVQGINANVMSLGGIAIAIGAMVDGAIVLVENAYRRLAAEAAQTQNALTSDQRWRVIENASRELGKPIFYSLLIVTLSFLPVFALEAQEGRLFAPLAFTKTYSMAASAILAVFLVPVLLGFFLRGNLRSEQTNPINRFLERAFGPVISRVVKYPVVVLVVGVLCLVGGLLPVVKLGSEFMPPLDEGDLMYMPSTFPGISTDKARELLQQTDRLIATVPEVESVFGKVGRADTATDPAPLTMIETVIQLKPRSEWRTGLTMDDLRDELNSIVQIPGVNNSWVMPIKARIDMLATGIKTPVGIKISGADLDVINQIGTQIEQTLVDVEGTSSVYAERVAGGRYVEVEIDRERAARFGLNIDDVQDVVRTAIGGTNVSYTVEGLERYPINLRYPQHVRDSLASLEMLPIVTPDGYRVPLIDVADVTIANGPPMIKSENARPNGWVYVDIANRDLGSYVTDAKAVLDARLDLPVGYSIRWSGQYEFLERAERRLGIVMPFTLAVIVVLLFLNFGRLAEVVIVLATVPFALIGGILFIYLLDYNLSVAVAVGFIALFGVAVELGVVMLTFLNMALQDHLERARAVSRSFEKSDLIQATIEGVKKRLRPIMMTTLTIVFGLIPIMISSGTGSEVMRRIAAPMIGGMASATVMVLLLVPAAFILWKERTELKHLSQSE